MMNNCNCCEDSNEIKITLEEESPIDINLDNRLNIVPIKNHDELAHLDYEESGHTGFTPSKLSLLPDADGNMKNDRLYVITNYNNQPTKITIRQLQDRMIRTASVMPNDLEVGQYLFLERNGGQNNGD